MKLGASQGTGCYYYSVPPILLAQALPQALVKDGQRVVKSGGAVTRKGRKSGAELYASVRGAQLGRKAFISKSLRGGQVRRDKYAGYAPQGCSVPVLLVRVGVVRETS